MNTLQDYARPDAQGVRALVRDLEAAWNRNDGFAYASLFTQDCDYVAFDGTRLKGWLSNAEHHQRLFNTVLKGSRLQFSNVTIRFLTPHVAIMHGDGSVMMPWQTTVSAARRSLQTYVVIRDEDGWRITAFHNARVRPITVPQGWMLRLVLAYFRMRTVIAGFRQGRSQQHAAVRS